MLDSYAPSPFLLMNVTLQGEVCTVQHAILSPNLRCITSTPVLFILKESSLDPQVADHFD